MLRLKPVAQAVGLVAVMVILLAVPGVTQQNPLTRQDVVSAVSDFLGVTFTASAADILDPELVTFISTTDVTLTFIPIARETESAQRFIDEFLRGNNDEFAPILLGVMLVDQHPTFPQGSFQVFLTPQGLQLVNQDGDIVVESIGHVVRPNPKQGATLAEAPFMISFAIEEKLEFESTATVESKSSCATVDVASAAKCEVKKLCSYFKILGWTIWESCQDVLVCE